MNEPSLLWRVKHAWNVFRNRDPTTPLFTGSSSRQERRRTFVSNERSIIQAMFNRMSMDVASQTIKHVLTDQDGGYLSEIKSGLNNCLNLEANIDQTGRELIQDIVLSLFDEGVVAVVPIDVEDVEYVDMTSSGVASQDKERLKTEIKTLRVGKITSWGPTHVKVDLYNDRTGFHQEVPLEKSKIAIIQNPLYSVINSPNGVFQRLIHKLNQLDAIDDQSSSGKLDIIIQLPYVVRNDAKRIQAEERRKALEEQMAGSKYGIGYIDGTERITQLNRAAENNMMAQIEYLTRMLHSQLGLTTEVFNGTADERTMLNYHSSTIEPLVKTIINEMIRKFLSEEDRAERQTIMFFRGIFQYATTTDIANAADKFTRNEILSPNEVRAELGWRPSKDPKSDELRNRNIQAPKTEDTPPKQQKDQEIEDEEKNNPA